MGTMRREGGLLLLLAFLCSSFYAAPLLSAEQYTPLLMVTARDVYLTAGAENRMEIELKNKGDFSVYEVEVTLSVPATTPGVSIIEEAHKIYNEIEGGETKSYGLVLYVDRDTPLGAYTLTCLVTYIKMYKLGTQLPASATIQLGVVVKDISRPEIRLSVEVEDPRLKAGAEGEMGIILENVGEETLYEVETTIASASPYIAVLEGARFNVASLEANASFTGRPTVAISRAAPLGVYTLTAAVSYEDIDGKGYLDTFTLGVNVDTVAVAEQTSIVLSRFTLSPEVVKPGYVADLELELACRGAAAHDVETLISLAPGGGLSPLSPTLVSLGDLSPGQTAASSYRLLVDGRAASGQYPASVAISFLDSDGAPRSVVETVVVSVSGIVSMRLLNAPVVVVEQGGVFSLEADLLLIGTESIRFVQVEAVGAGPFEGTSDSSEYIGSVDPDSPIPFDIEFAVEADAAPGSHVLTLNVTYLDDLNRVRSSVLPLPVSVVEARIEQGAQSSALGGFWIWLRRLFGLMP